MLCRLHSYVKAFSFIVLIMLIKRAKWNFTVSRTDDQCLAMFLYLIFILVDKVGAKLKYYLWKIELCSSLCGTELDVCILHPQFITMNLRHHSLIRIWVWRNVYEAWIFSVFTIADTVQWRIYDSNPNFINI